MIGLTIKKHPSIPLTKSLNPIKTPHFLPPDKISDSTVALIIGTPYRSRSSASNSIYFLLIFFSLSFPLTLPLTSYHVLLSPKMSPALDPRITEYLTKNKRVPETPTPPIRVLPSTDLLIIYREWAQSPSYKSPVPFSEMQRKGRKREDGTIIIGIL